MSWADYLERVTYKPGVEFVHMINPWGYEQLTIRMMVRDSRGSGQKIPVRSSHLLPEFNRISEHNRARYILYLIRVLESHEIDEWYKIDGELVNDPHSI